ncbi:nucleoside-diphosphate-sugar epimerase [Sphingomonas sp. BE138]|uniref:NAD-dependent epimerase/dehydratase family protein n=1 Tax=Sphingomonas sp. BE138 TaxID=2817845 RepID=UPI0028582ECF|nr:NAD-dependent epimerase/dehydratase family protein [Sphingomonas sp. BE138]MDR6789420.1 nucleoside-diphosphate-sugar epimerase [Sphingomonas sp. BE138]
MILAVTGGTGFVGGAVIDQALAAGHHVRALARRQQAPREGVTWIAGALDDRAAISALVSTADAVLHIAGAVNAADRAAFAAANIHGTRHVVEAARTWDVRRFVHVSSLAAREPTLSNYGWSKAGAEQVVTDSALDWTIVRPPGVYGPGDMEQRDLFRAARRTGIVPMPPHGRLSIIHVDDLARLLLALAHAPADRAIYEPSDGAPLTYADFARAIGAAVGRRVRPLSLPPALLRTAARADRLLRGRRAKLTADRVAYMLHPDWTADPAKAPPPDVWQPRIAAAHGLADTAQWYRARGLL